MAKIKPLEKKDHSKIVPKLIILFILMGLGLTVSVLANVNKLKNEQVLGEKKDSPSFYVSSKPADDIRKFSDLTYRTAAGL